MVDRFDLSLALVHTAQFGIAHCFFLDWWPAVPAFRCSQGGDRLPAGQFSAIHTSILPASRLPQR